MAGSRTQIARLTMRSLEIPFRLAFSHASARRERTHAVLVTATSTDGLTGYGESCPREYVTGESVDSVRRFFEAHEFALTGLSCVAAIEDWRRAQKLEIDRNPAAWCAIETALLDLHGRSRQQSLETLLGLPELEGSFQYSAVIGSDRPRVLDKLLSAYLEMGFRDFKIKLFGDPARDRITVESLRRQIDDGVRVRFDANNAWPDADSAIRDLEALGCPFWAVEEPVAAGDLRQLAQIAAALDTRIILDESAQRPDQLERLPGEPGRWLVNLRVSKMGGICRSLEMVDACRMRGIGIVVGAQVGETSLLTRAALTIAASARDLVVAQEGAFGSYLLERDIAEPELRFGAGGRLDADTLGIRERFGSGLVVEVPG